MYPTVNILYNVLSFGNLLLDFFAILFAEKASVRLQYYLLRLGLKVGQKHQSFAVALFLAFRMSAKDAFSALFKQQRSK